MSIAVLDYANRSVVFLYEGEKPISFALLVMTNLDHLEDISSITQFHGSM